MAKKIFTDESLATFVDEVKSYTDSAVSTKANSSHNHAASNITSGTLSSDRLPTVPITKGGTGATTAAAALTNLGITATAAELNKLDGITATTAELNYVDGVTSNIQTQLDGKASSSHTHDYLPLTGGTVSGDITIDGVLTLINSSDGGSRKLMPNNDTADIKLYLPDNNNRTLLVGIETSAGTKYASDEGILYGVCLATEDYVNEQIPDYITTGAKSGATIGENATAEGYYTEASGIYSHAEGTNTTASGSVSHAEGVNTTASGMYSHAEGYYTTASGNYSHAGNYQTTANDYQYVVGRYNASTTAPTSTSDTTTSAGLFIVGIGTSSSNRKNGFRVNPAGKVYGTGTFGTSGADYAEYFEWFDGNPNNEDRRGHFVTLEGDKIRYATPNDGYILGVVSADPSVAGDIHSEDWHNRYLKDVFGSKIVEVVEVEETTNEDGEIIPTHTERRWVLNPDYDPNVKYTSREERPEWAAIGIIGKLVVVDDGTCQVNGYCQPNADGIATASQEKTNYRVMERLDDTHIRIFIR